VRCKSSNADQHRLQPPSHPSPLRVQAGIPREGCCATSYPKGKPIRKAFDIGKSAMNRSGQKVVSPHDPLAAFIYWFLSVLLFPVTLIGYVIWVGRALLARRGSGVSGTAQGPLSARFFEHHLGTREDEPASRLMMALPNVPPLGLRLFVWPMLLAHRATGFVPRAFRYPFEGEVPPQYQASARMTFFDAAVERYLGRIAQFVILGAGFDTRAFRLPKEAGVRSFEIDAPKTQAVKRESLERAGIDSAGVTFVAADFEKDDWLTRLLDAGFDPGEPALFLWEGVMTYLDREAVEATLRKIASTAKGSAVAFDYFTTEPLESRALYWRYARAGTTAAGEPLKFGIDSTPPSSARLAELLRSCGLSLGEQRTLGQETKGKRAWGGFAIAVVV
jgi:methyltransferase (TIGR00027 family)